MGTEPGSPDYAKQKFCEAVYALISTAPIDYRLTYAAGHLMFLQPRDLPTGMRDDFEKLMRKLTRVPLSSATANMPRPISEDDALDPRQSGPRKPAPRTPGLVCERRPQHRARVHRPGERPQGRAQATAVCRAIRRRPPPEIRLCAVLGA